MNLSQLNLTRNAQYGDGNFKGLHLKNSNFDGASLRRADLSEAKRYQSVVTIDADVTGMYHDSPPDRRSLNFMLVAKNRAHLIRFRKEVLGMNVDGASVEVPCASSNVAGPSESSEFNEQSPPSLIYNLKKRKREDEHSLSCLDENAKRKKEKAEDSDSDSESDKSSKLSAGM